MTATLPPTEAEVMALIGEVTSAYQIRQRVAEWAEDLARSVHCIGAMQFAEPEGRPYSHLMVTWRTNCPVTAERRCRIEILLTALCATADGKELCEVIETGGGHACELETSLLMASRPDLVDTAAIPPGKAPWHEMEPTGAEAGIEWSLTRVEAYEGEPSRATPEKGAILMNEAAAKLAEIIRRVKSFDPELPPSRWPHSE